jgi:hypothetical protein
MLKKLRVYAGPEHPHQAQRPEPVGLEATPGVRPGDQGNENVEGVRR